MTSSPYSLRRFLIVVTLCSFLSCPSTARACGSFGRGSCSSEPGLSASHWSTRILKNRSQSGHWRPKSPFSSAGNRDGREALGGLPEVQRTYLVRRTLAPDGTRARVRRRRRPLRVVRSERLSIPSTDARSSGEATARGRGGRALSYEADTTSDVAGNSICPEPPKAPSCSAISPRMRSRSSAPRRLSTIAIAPAAPLRNSQ